jgi:hypothetical protein
MPVLVTGQRKPNATTQRHLRDFIVDLEDDASIAAVTQLGTRNVAIRSV